MILEKWVKLYGSKVEYLTHPPLGTDGAPRKVRRLAPNAAGDVAQQRAPPGYSRRGILNIGASDAQGAPV